MAVLVWESPGGRVVYPLERRAAVVGRDPASDLVLDDASVSRRHALLELAPGGVKVTDLGSTTGTRINGAALTPHLPSTLAAGDFVTFGRVMLTFHATPPPAVAPPPAAAPPAGVAVPAPAPPPRARGSPRAWLLPAGLAAALAAGVGLAILTRGRGGDEAPPAATLARTEGERPPPPAPAPPKPPPEPAPAPASPPPLAEEPAKPREGLPPPADAEGLTELLEIDGERYLPARLAGGDRDRLLAVGSDGATYAVARARVTRVIDRADLERRVALRRRALAPGDAEGRRLLAHYCAGRFLRHEAEQLCREWLDLEPESAEARDLLRTLGG
jgi:hypothetical protein